MPHDSASSIEKMIQSPPKTAPTITSYISVTKNALKNPKTAPETSNHYLCKSICRTTISFKLKPGQNSKDFQLTIFEFVQPKKNMSIVGIGEELPLFSSARKLQGYSSPVSKSMNTHSAS